LEVGAVRARADLAVAILARQPNLEMTGDPQLGHC